MKITIITPLLLSLLMIGCGGSGGKSTNSNSSTPNANTPPPTASSTPVAVSSVAPASSAAATSAAPLLTGVFLDAAVINIGYRTASQQGFTNANGEFNYRPGEMITFFIGSLEFPPVLAGDIVTPMDIANTTDLSNNQLINILRLLQSLDADGDLTNGIGISAAALAAGVTLDFTMPPEVFAQSPAVLSLLQAAGSPNQTLVSTAQALAHFQTTLEFINGPASSSSSAALSSTSASSLPAQASSAAVASSLPALPSSAAVASSQPAQASSAAVASSQPAQASSAAVASSQPAQASSAAVASSQPAQASSAAVASSQPAQASSAAVASSVPALSSSSVVASSTPVAAPSSVPGSSSSAVSSVVPSSAATISSVASSAAESSVISSVASSDEAASESSSSAAPVNNLLIDEAFNVDKSALFSAAYQAISTDASAARYFITGGGTGITLSDNQLSLAGARLSIGHRPPRTSTTTGDTSANGDFDLSRPYRISFTVVAASGAGKVQVYIDNNTTSQGNSLHGANSKVFEAVASSLTVGQVVEITPAVGTANSFIALRTESSATLVLDNLQVEYTDGLGVSGSSAASSSSAAALASSSAVSTSAAPGAEASSSSMVGNSSSSAAASSEPVDLSGLRPAKMEGFAAHAGVTGGAGGPVITVTTGTELNAALCGVRNSNRAAPVVIMVNGTINHGNTTAQGCNTQADVIEIKQMSNVSIIGVGSNALFDEIGIHVRDASNIIIQNVHVRNVKKSGSPTSNGGDAIGMESNVNRVWIDHNRLEASGGEQEGYDSLLDMKSGVTNVTVSYNLFNDSSRAGLVGFNDTDTNTNITFHHNWYKNIEQRTPLVRNALVHVYNNYWSNERIDYMFHAINSRANAKVLVESNYFYNVNNPLIASTDSPTPGCWQTNNENTVLPYIYYSRTVENGQAHAIPAVVDGQLQSNCVVTVPYSVDMDNSLLVPTIVMANAGVGKIATGGEGSGSSSSAQSSAVSSVVEQASSSAASVVSSSAASSAVEESSSSAASVVSSAGEASESSSSASSVNNNSVLINEVFSVDKTTLFSAAYQAISTDASAPLYFITSGGSGITVSNNALSIVGGRLTIGHRPPRAATLVGDTSANGDFDLSRPYRISFTVVAASGAGKVQVYIDNNTTSQGNSMHGANSKVFEAVASSLTAGQQVEITPAVGTAGSFIALRTESSATVVIDNLRVEYTDLVAGSSASSTEASASSAGSSIASSDLSSSAESSSESSLAESSASSSSSVAASSEPASSAEASSSEQSSEAQSSEPASSEASSSAASVSGVFIHETFDVDKTALFSAEYHAISTDSSAALYFITGGGTGITIANNALSLAGGRLTIGHRPPRTNTTAGDSSANGDFDLSRPYRISFTVVA
ncbi:MAG: hypothetical protein U1B30_02145, partial [Pseudomonadota bacterium]|nr:hypothetical protein [Pseudomonadota bacterium]